MLRALTLYLTTKKKGKKKKEEDIIIEKKIHILANKIQVSLIISYRSCMKINGCYNNYITIYYIFIYFIFSLCIMKIKEVSECWFLFFLEKLNGGCYMLKQEK